MWHAICEDERPLDRLCTAFSPWLREVGVHPSKPVSDQIAVCADLLGPRCKEQPVGLVLDLLTHLRTWFGGAERVRRHKATLSQSRQRRAHVLRTLVRQELGERRLVGSLATPDSREHLNVGSRESRRAPRREVTVVTDLPEPIDGGVELRERARGRGGPAICARAQRAVSVSPVAG